MATKGAILPTNVGDGFEKIQMVVAERCNHPDFPRGKSGWLQHFFFFFGF